MAEVRLAAQALEKYASTLLLQSQKNMLNLQGGMYLQQLRVGQQVGSLEEKVDELTSKLDRVNKLELIVPMIFNNIQPMLDDEWNRESAHHKITS